MATSKHPAVHAINDAFFKLMRAIQSDRNESRYFEMCEESERRHRRCAPFGTKWRITIDTAARLFYVRNVLCYLVPGERTPPKAEDFFSIREDVFAGYAMFANHQDEIRAAFTEDEARLFMTIDYSDLV